MVQESQISNLQGLSKIEEIDSAHDIDGERKDIDQTGEAKSNDEEPTNEPVHVDHQLEKQSKTGTNL